MERICLSRELELIFSSGSSLFAYPFKVVWQIAEKCPTDPSVMMMVSVGKKRFKHAVDRNKVKRRVREAYRLNRTILVEALEQMPQQKLLVGFLYVGKDMMSYKDMEGKMVVLMNKLVKELNKVEAT